MLRALLLALASFISRLWLSLFQRTDEPAGMSARFLIVGLGNPAPLRSTRHSIGAMALDHFASSCGASWRSSKSAGGDVAEVMACRVRV